MASNELENLARRIRAAKREGEAWPMIVYEDILTMADRWDIVGRGSGHKTFNAWLVAEVTDRSWSLGKFKFVRDVVGKLGEHVRRTWQWLAAQWAYNNLSDEELKIVRDSYTMWLQKQHHGHPLSRGMLQRHVREMRAGKKAE
ncbi:MAG: hypothetical protein WC683_16185 [bacterium]